MALHKSLFLIIWEFPVFLGKDSVVIYCCLFYCLEFKVIILLDWLPTKTCMVGKIHRESKYFQLFNLHTLLFNSWLGVEEIVMLFPSLLMQQTRLGFELSLQVPLFMPIIVMQYIDKIIQSDLFNLAPLGPGHYWTTGNTGWQKSPLKKPCVNIVLPEV